MAKNVQDLTKKIGIDSEKLIDDAEKLFEKAKKYEFTQTPEGKDQLVTHFSPVICLEIHPFLYRSKHSGKVPIEILPGKCHIT